MKLCETCRYSKGQRHSCLVKSPWIILFVSSLIRSTCDVLLCPLLSAAIGAAVALPGRVAGADLHWAGQEQEEPLFVFLQQWDSLPASQTTGGRPSRLHAKAPLFTGSSDCHGNRGVRRRRGRYLYDGQSAQRRDPGFLHVLLLPDATRVCTLWYLIDREKAWLALQV